MMNNDIRMMSYELNKMINTNLTNN